MFKIHVFDRELGEFQDIEFNESDIVRFGIFNRKLWNRNNTFKKFDKRAFVDLKTYEYIRGEKTQITCRYDSYQTDLIKELKTALKGKYTTSKNEEFEYKNYNERKAIDWTYEIIKEEVKECV